MKKTLVLSLILLLALSIFAGCGGTKTVEFDPQAAADALHDAKAFSDILSPVQSNVAAMLYNMDAESIADCSVYCSTGATAEEIAVFRCKDDAAASALVQNARQRLQSQKDAYASYAPQEVPKLENALLRTSGAYVICVVANDYDAITPILDQYLK